MDLRTDLAYEAVSYAPTQLSGIRSKTDEMEHNVHIHTVEVLNEEGEKQVGKPVGTYITVEARCLLERDLDVQKYVTLVIGNQIKKLINEALSFDKDQPTLIIGIGNRGMTADALGSKTCDGIIVTRHAYEMIQHEIDSRLSSVCAIAPGVLGVTGIETFDIVSGLVEKIKPQLVIVIDSLASQKTERISTTFQMTDTGIVPGGGIGNARAELSKKSLGIPVISVGVPLVVYAKTIAHDVLNELHVDTPDHMPAVNAVVTDVLGDLVVTPKEIDKIVDDSSFIVSTALNLALHRELSMDDVISYVH